MCWVQLHRSDEREHLVRPLHCQHFLQVNLWFFEFGLKNLFRSQLGQSKLISRKIQNSIPGHASCFFSKISLQLSHTRTGYGQPRAGTGISLPEHWLQKPSPQPRQWCFRRSLRSKFILHALHTWNESKIICFYLTQKPIEWTVNSDNLYVR